jgi:hypothetical protein
MQRGLLSIAVLVVASCRVEAGCIDPARLAHATISIARYFDDKEIRELQPGLLRSMASTRGGSELHRYAQLALEVVHGLVPDHGDADFERRGPSLRDLSPDRHVKRENEITFVAGLRLRRITAPFVIEGAMNGSIGLRSGE